MTLEEATKICFDNDWICSTDGSLYSLGSYLCMNKSFLVLDGDQFTPDELIAIGIYTKEWRKTK